MTFQLLECNYMTNLKSSFYFKCILDEKKKQHVSAVVTI